MVNEIRENVAAAREALARAQGRLDDEADRLDALESDVAVSEFDGPPAHSALKAAWVGYAVSQGADADSVGDLTKDELIEKYGGD